MDISSLQKDGDPAYQLARDKVKVTGSKERGCPASIYLREVITFPGYQVCTNVSCI